ncbi:MAG TPA: flagellar hook capping FlgD N-terminal domain-containing protein [Planctomycetaceae bacterium]
MPVSGVTSNSTATVVPKDRTGFNALTSEDFLKILVTQLQNQDPTQPVGNDELLNQLSMMRNLQANLELGEAMKAVTSNQNLATASSFIGKTVKGTDAAGKAVTGKVDSAFVADGQAYVRVGGTAVSLTSVSEVAAN